MTNVYANGFLSSETAQIYESLTASVSTYVGNQYLPLGPNPFIESSPPAQPNHISVWFLTLIIVAIVILIGLAVCFLMRKETEPKAKEIVYKSQEEPLNNEPSAINY